VDSKDKFIVALIVEKENDFSNYAIIAPTIVLVHLANQKVVNIETFPNPALNEKPSVSLPPFLKSHNVSYLLGDKIGEGLKNSLLARGIFFKKIPPLKSLDEIPTHICKPL
jgi:predicted Fe-Mo cluster-binding NifX family protein